MTKKQILVSDLSKGFHKITFEDGVFEYITPSKLEKLKEDKGFKLVNREDKKGIIDVTPTSNDDDNTGSAQDLSKLNKAALTEIAQRLGFGDVNDQITKAMLVKYINENDK